MDLRKAEALARSLIAEHIDPRVGDVPVPVTFVWSRRTSAFGHYTVRRCAVNGYQRIIALSRPITLVCEEAKVRDTILHEVAHALAGIRAGHGALWEAQCLRIGAKPQRCGGTLGVDVPLPLTGWDAKCPVCGKVHWKARAPKRPLACLCGGRRFTSERLLAFRRR